MELAVPLSQQQVDRACRVHETLAQWRLAESALEKLADRFPGFSAEACLLKTVAVNEIYGTQLFATVRMARHIEAIFADPSTSPVDFDLVERIAKLPPKQGEKQRLSVSFASKFCHFFVNAERFPIYDDAARDAIRLHLGADAYCVNNDNRYRAFCENFEKLRTLAKLKCTTKELDQYLWLIGMYKRWLKEKSKPNPRVNEELRGLFQQPTPELKAMLPNHLAARIGQQAPER
jgi:hypothetical protein